MSTQDLFADLSQVQDGYEHRPDALATALDWARVRAFLRDHPSLLLNDGELLIDLNLRPTGPNVIEFGRAALARLESRIQVETQAKHQLETLAKANYAAQVQTHDAVIELLNARNPSDLARRLMDTAKDRFGLTCGLIGVEGRDPAGWVSLEDGAVDYIIGDDANARLGRDVVCEAVFEGHVFRVKSAAIIRISLWAGRVPALLAFGSNDYDGFTRDMGNELVLFLSRAVECVANRWPCQ